MNKQIKEIILITIIVFSLVGIYILTFNIFNKDLSSSNISENEQLNNFSNIKPVLKPISLNKIQELSKAAEKENKILNCTLYSDEIDLLNPITKIKKVSANVILLNPNLMVIKIIQANPNDIGKVIFSKDLKKIIVFVEDNMVGYIYLYKDGAYIYKTSKNESIDFENLNLIGDCYSIKNEKLKKEVEEILKKYKPLIENYDHLNNTNITLVYKAINS